MGRVPAWALEVTMGNGSRKGEAMNLHRSFMLGIALVVVLGISAVVQSDPLVEEMVSTVSQSRVTGHVQTLQDFVKGPFLDADSHRP